MRAGIAIGAVVAALMTGTVANAQPADLPIPAATTADYPPGIAVGSADGRPVYVGRDGRTLYGMDMRTLLRAGPDPSQYCKGACAEQWEPVLAPADAKPNIRYPLGNSGGGDFIQNQKAPDWTVIQGAQGPQWVYKGWHMVFVRKGEAPGTAQHEGEGNRSWNTLKFVPPVPKLTAPANVAAAFVGGAYAFADDKGRLLFTGACETDCAGWRPLVGGMANRGVGEWTVGNAADTAQWLYRGKPVFVAEGSSLADVPRGATALRP